MPKYFYTAKSLKGEAKSGFLEAKDETELSRFLHREGYVLVSLSEKGAEKKMSISLPFFGGVPLTEKMMAIRNLQVMIKAGIPLPRALRILAAQAKSKRFREALAKIADEIIKGKTLSLTIAQYPDIFSEIFVNMVKVGEEAGTLENVLATLNRQMEREHDLKSKIQGAMVYPAVIILAMIGIGILMLILVVPKLAETFKELKIELPATTRSVIALGTFLATKWWLALILISGLFFGLNIILKTKKGKRTMDAIVLKLPVISPLVSKTNSAYMTRTLSSLIAAGIPIVRALEITAGALGNTYFKEALMAVMVKVSRGAKLFESMKSYENIYPIMVTQMVEVGEETGETADMLEHLANFYEEEVANTTKNMAAVIEPVLMLLIGGLVGFFAISMVQPMYTMLGAIE